MLRSFCYSLVALSLLSVSTAQGTARAQSVGDLMVAPTRMVFDDATPDGARQKSAEINLINRGDKDATYRVSFINMTMKEDGTYEEITKPTDKWKERFAEEMIKYSPRQVTLKPGEVQKVRLMLRKPADCQGEYRSHMLFRALPPKDVGTDVENLKLETGQLAVRLIPIFGISIPVIVRCGKISGQAEIAEASIQAAPNNAEKKSDQELVIKLNRSGDASVYGDIIATTNAGGKDVVISELRGVSVLTPYNSRTVTSPIVIPQGVTVSGPIRVLYRKTSEEGGAALAERTIQSR